MKKPQLIFALKFNTTESRALSKLTRALPVRYRGAVSGEELQAAVLERLVLMALANIEVIAPRFRGSISYCRAEGLDLFDYLDALIETKFKKKLHLARERPNANEYDD